MLQGGTYKGGKVFTHLETPSQREMGADRTSEGSTATGEQKAKQREFSTEISANQHFPA